MGFHRQKEDRHRVRNGVNDNRESGSKETHVATLPINSVTGSCSPSVLMVPAMLSFSKMGRKSCTKSEVYGGAMTSST